MGKGVFDSNSETEEDLALVNIDYMTYPGLAPAEYQIPDRFGTLLKETHS